MTFKTLRLINETGRASVLTINIPGSFNQLYWQGTATTGRGPQFTYTCVYIHEKMFRSDLESTRSWLMETPSGCDSRRRTSVDQRATRLRFWNTWRSRSPSSTATAAHFRCIWLHPQVCTLLIHVNSTTLEDLAWDGGRKDFPLFHCKYFLRELENL